MIHLGIGDWIGSRPAAAAGYAVNEFIRPRVQWVARRYGLQRSQRLMEPPSGLHGLGTRDGQLGKSRHGQGWRERRCRGDVWWRQQRPRRQATIDKPCERHRPDDDPGREPGRNPLPACAPGRPGGELFVRGPPHLEHRRRLGDVFEPFDPSEQGERFFRRRPMIDGRGDQLTRFRRLPTIECRTADVQQFFALPQPLRYRPTRPLDIGACPRMPTVDEQDAGPDVDREIVLFREIMVEAGEKQLLDPGITVAFRHVAPPRVTVGAQRIGHEG